MIIQFSLWIFGVFISLAEICPKELKPSWALWKSLIWTDCVTSASSCASWQLNSSKALFSSCSFDELSGISLMLRRVSQHPPGRITVNPEAADPLWGTFQPFWFVCCYSYLDREFLWLLSFPGTVSFNDTIPSCLKEEVSLVAVQIPKSWFHFGPQTEWFEAALDFSSVPLWKKSLCPGLVLFHCQKTVAQEALIKLHIH